MIHAAAKDRDERVIGLCGATDGAFGTAGLVTCRACEATLAQQRAGARLVVTIQEHEENEVTPPTPPWWRRWFRRA